MTDWEAARIAYVTTDKTCREIAAELGIGERSVQSRCAAAGWVAQRRLWRARAAAMAMTEAQARQAEQATAVFEGLMVSQAATVEKLRAALEDEHVFHRYVVTEKADGESAQKETVFRKPNFGEIKTAAGTIKTLVESGRDLFGIPGVREAELMELAKEKLALEKSRNGTETESIEVKLGEAEEWSE